METLGFVGFHVKLAGMRITSSERKLGEWRRVRVVDCAAREICGEPFDLLEFLRSWAVILDTLEAHGVDRQRRAGQANLPGVQEAAF